MYLLVDNNGMPLPSQYSWGSDYFSTTQPSMKEHKENMTELSLTQLMINYQGNMIL